MANVKLPSGKIVKIPEGKTEKQAIEFLFENLPDSPEYEKDKEILGKQLDTSGWGSTIGGTIGGLVGAGAGILTAPTVVANPITLGAAGGATGSALGEALEQYFTGKGSWDDVLKSGAWGGLFGGAGGGAGQALARGAIKTAATIGAGTGAVEGAKDGGVSGAFVGAGVGAVGGGLAGKGISAIAAKFGLDKPVKSAFSIATDRLKGEANATWLKLTGRGTAGNLISAASKWQFRRDLANKLFKATKEAFKKQTGKNPTAAQEAAMRKVSKQEVIEYDDFKTAQQKATTKADPFQDPDYKPSKVKPVKIKGQDFFEDVDSGRVYNQKGQEIDPNFAMGGEVPGYAEGGYVPFNPNPFLDRIVQIDRELEITPFDRELRKERELMVNFLKKKGYAEGGMVPGYQEGGVVQDLKQGTNVRDFLNEYILGPRTQLKDLSDYDAAELGVDFTPIIGDIKAGKEAIEYGQQGKYLEAGVSGAAALIGLIPIVGDVVAKGLKAAIKSGNRTEANKLVNANPDHPDVQRLKQNPEGAKELFKNPWIIDDAVKQGDFDTGTFYKSHPSRKEPYSFPLEKIRAEQITSDTPIRKHLKNMMAYYSHKGISGDQPDKLYDIITKYHLDDASDITSDAGKQKFYQIARQALGPNNSFTREAARRAFPKDILRQAAYKEIPKEKIFRNTEGRPVNLNLTHSKPTDAQGHIFRKAYKHYKNEFPEWSDAELMSFLRHRHTNYDTLYHINKRDYNEIAQNYRNLTETAFPNTSEFSGINNYLEKYFRKKAQGSLPKGVNTSRFQGTIRGVDYDQSKKPFVSSKPADRSNVEVVSAKDRFKGILGDKLNQPKSSGGILDTATKPASKATGEQAAQEISKLIRSYKDADMSIKEIANEIKKSYSHLSGNQFNKAFNRGMQINKQ